MGLGLYIVRTVAEGHEGRAYVEDREGGGSRFVMELPTATDERRRMHAQRARAAADESAQADAEAAEAADPAVGERPSA